jgi:hypothetical protein
MRLAIPVRGAPRRHQLVVIALDEILPRELSVSGLGGRGGQIEAQGVGVVVAEEVGHVDGSSPTLAELSTFEVDVFMVTRDKTRSL